MTDTNTNTNTMDENQLQAVFVGWLAQKTGAMDEEGNFDEAHFTEVLNNLSEEEMEKIQEQFLNEFEAMQEADQREAEQAEIAKAEMGMKLDYIKSLHDYMV